MLIYYHSRDVVTFLGFVDCIYVDAPDEVHLDNGLGDSITIRNTKYDNALDLLVYLVLN